MILGRDRLIGVVAGVEALRDRYSALQRPLSWRTMALVLRGEQVRVLRHEMDCAPYVIGMPPAFTIVLNRDHDRHEQLGWAAHELAHILLHFDRDEKVKQLSPCLADDPREAEAKLFARMLMLGAAGTPDHPKVRPLVAALVGGEYRRAMPAQYPLELHEGIPVYGAETFAWHEEQLAAAQPNPRLARLPDAKRVRLAGARDPFTAKFVDRVGRVWHIYDRPGRRLFYNSMVLRKSYRFVAGEITALKAKHLDRQLLQSRVVEATTQRRPDENAPTRRHDSAVRSRHR